MTDIVNNIYKVLLEEIKKNRTELKFSIEASETRVLLKIAELNGKVNKLEKENTQLKSKIELLERGLKKNNILIYGLKLDTNSTSDIICKKIEELLEISISKNDINNYYVVNAPKSPIKIELISHLKKKEIFKNCRKLKGTNISVTNDLTYKQRQDHKILTQYLKEARENKQKSYIRGNKLYIDKKQFTVDELDSLVNRSAANSEPSTPTTSRNLAETYIDTCSEETSETISGVTEHQEKQKSTPQLKHSNTVKPQNPGRERLRSYNKQKYNLHY